jgi:pyroglutamyl-peptidase
MSTKPRSRRMPTILLIGFEAFGGDELNPAQEIVRELDGRRIEGHRVVSRVLPVAFAAAITEVAHALEQERPVLALAIGLAAGRARLSIERVFINLIDARIPDNHGAQPIDVAVVAEAPPAYFANLPVKAMLHDLLAAGIPAELSLTAGSYVCNAIGFALGHLAASRYTGMRTGFIHLPLLPAQASRLPGTPSLDLQTQCRGIEQALRSALLNTIDRGDVAGTIC